MESLEPGTHSILGSSLVLPWKAEGTAEWSCHHGRPLMHGQAGKLWEERHQERAARRASSPSLNRSFLELGSYTETSCTSYFQGKSSPLDRSPSLCAEQTDRTRHCEMTILSPVCAGSPQGQAAKLQEGRDPQREPGLGCWDRALLRGGGDPVEYVTPALPACTLQ